MTTVQQWGRRESIIWPPRGFYFTYGAIFLAAVTAGFLMYVQFRFSFSPLEKYYVPYYIRTDLAGLFRSTGMYQLVYISDGKSHSRLAMDGDVSAGETQQLSGRALIRILVEGIAELDRNIEAGVAAHPDFFIFDSLPGAGAARAPRLLAAFGSQRGCYGSAQEVQAYSRIAPVIERSGKRSGSISDGPPRSFFDKVFTSGLGVLLRNRPGHALTTSNNVNGARGTMLRSGHWPSNGSVSHSDAGKMVSLMMRAGT